MSENLHPEYDSSPVVWWGHPGASAYELAVKNGFNGSLAEWLESLKGEPGSDGKAPSLAVVGDRIYADGKPISGNLPDGSGVSTTDPRLTDARTPTAHTHTVTNVTGLQGALDGKVSTTDPRLTNARTPTAHTHTVTNVTGLQDALDGKVSTTDPRLTNATLEILPLAPGLINGRINARRTGNVVMLYANGVQFATAGPQVIATLPIGWRPASPIAYFNSIIYWGVDKPASLRLASTGVLETRQATLAPDTYNWHVTYITADPIN